MSQETDGQSRSRAAPQLRFAWQCGMNNPAQVPGWIPGCVLVPQVGEGRGESVGSGLWLCGL